MYGATWWQWAAFNVFVLAMLAIDLGVFNRKAHAPSFKEALAWTGVWVSLALVFCGIVFLWHGSQPSIEFITGYLIEYSLSVDNIFVFVLLFSFFRVPSIYQHRVLFWGIIGALIMRGTMIMLGSALLTRFEWIIYIFGAFLVYTGIKMAFQKEETEVHPENNLLVRAIRRIIPVTKEYHHEHFFVKQNGKLWATPLLIVLLVVESTDLIFAVDSIPAIFAVTKDPFIVYTSNVFAILGLRSLYFLLAGVVDKFYYLRYALSIILTFVGVKMLTPEISHLVWNVDYHIPTFISLSVIIGVLVVAIVASWLRARRLGDRPGTPAEEVSADQQLATGHPELADTFDEEETARALKAAQARHSQ